MVYRFLILSDEDEKFMREYEFLDSQTLLDFHNMIQDELGFDRSQLASFFLTTDNWEKEEEFTLFDMGGVASTMEDAILEDVICTEHQKLVYIFDFFNERSLSIEFLGETEENKNAEYPSCVNSKGPAPKQILFNKGTKNAYKDIDLNNDEDDEDSDLLDEDDLFNDIDDTESLQEFDDTDDDSYIDDI